MCTHGRFFRCGVPPYPVTSRTRTPRLERDAGVLESATLASPAGSKASRRGDARSRSLEHEARPPTTHAATLQQLVLAIWSDFHHVHVLWQIAVIAIALLLAWLPVLAMRKRPVSASAPARLGEDALRALVFPLLALCLTLSGRALLRPWQPTALLDVMVPLLTALTLLRSCCCSCARCSRPAACCAPSSAGRLGRMGRLRVVHHRPCA